MITQIHIPKNQLPEELQRLADPDLPLSRPERFVPLPIGGGWLAVSVVTGCCPGCALLGSTVATESVLAIRGADYSPVNLWIAITFTAILVGWAIRQLILMREGSQKRRELATGRYRDGLFFESEYVLVVEGKWATIIPRDCVTEIARHAADYVESGAQAKGTYIEFVDHSGQQQSQWVPSGRWADHLRTWHQTGEVV